MSTTTNTTDTTTTTTNTTGTGLARIGAILIVVAGLLGLAAQPALAHEGHVPARQLTSETTDGPTRYGQATSVEYRGAAAAATLISTLHLTTEEVDRRIVTDELAIATKRLGGASPSADCFVDFSDELVLQFQPNHAEDTFLLSPWYQGCNDGSWYPAIGIEPMEYGHFHLGYEDPKVGPCEGDTTNWGRKADPMPSDNDDLGPWFLAPCTEDIDPVTEPRSGISAHAPGQRARVFAYEGHTDTEYLPFQMKTLEVVDGSVEVCHLPPGPIVAIPGAGSPWQCATIGEGYWNMSNIVDSAIEVRIEFLTNGTIDNVGIDLL